MPDVPKPGRMWKKRPRKTRDDQPVSCSQPGNNPAHPVAETPPGVAALPNKRPASASEMLDAIKAQHPGLSLSPKAQAILAANPGMHPARAERHARPRPLGAENNRLHSVRADALAFLGIKDIPPSPAESERARAKRLKAEAKANYTPSPDQHGQAIKNADETAFPVAALPMPEYGGNVQDHDIEEYIELTERGYLQVEIARLWKVRPTTLWEWQHRHVEQSARIERAEAALAEACDTKAYQLLADCKGKTGPEVAKAAAMARFLQWRASKYGKRYADKSELHVTGSMEIAHVTPDRPPITDLIEQQLRAFAPPTRLTDLDIAEPGHPENTEQAGNRT